MKKVLKKFEQSLSILLTIAMIITCVPETALAVFAAQDDAIEMEAETAVDDIVEAETSDTEGIIEEGGEKNSEVETPEAIEEEQSQDSEEASDEVDNDNAVASDEVVAEPEETVDEAEVSNADEAGSTAKSFDFKSITITDEIKNDSSVTWNEKKTTASYPYAENTKFDADGYFTTKGSVDLKFSDQYSSQGVEVAKAEGGAVVFTTTAKTNIKLVVASTGGNNKSSVALKKVENGAYSATAVNTKDDEGTVVVTGTGDGTLLEYTNVEAGTYAVVSPEDSANKRGARVYSIDITESEEGSGEGSGEGGETPTPPTPPTPSTSKTHTFDFKDITVTDEIKNDTSVTWNEKQTTATYPYADNTKFDADGYFSTKDSVALKFSNKFESQGVEVAKAEGGAVVFTTTTKTNINLTVASTGDSNNSSVALKKVENGVYSTTAVNTKDDKGTVVVTGTGDGTLLEYTNVEAGTYAVVSPEDSANKRGARVYKIEVTESEGGAGEGSGEGGDNPTPDVPVANPNVVDIQAVYTPNDIWFAATDTEPEKGVKFTEKTKLGDSIFYVVPWDSELSASLGWTDDNPVAIKGSNKNTVVWLAFNGPGTPATRAIEFTPEQTGVLTVRGRSSNSSERSLVWCKGTDTANEKELIKTTDAVKEVKVPVYAGETYYIYGKQGMFVSYLSLEYGEIPPELVPVEMSLTLSATEYVYNHSEQKPSLTVKLGDTVVEDIEANCDVSYTRNGEPTSDFVSAGTITVKVAGKAGTDYVDKSAEASYEIKPFELTADNASVNVVAPVYEGEQPTVRVLEGPAKEKNQLSESDYTLTYANAANNTTITNTNVTSVAAGTKVRVTATGAGNYTGSVSGEYNVVRKPAGMGTATYTVRFYINKDNYDSLWEGDYEYEYEAGSFITIPEEVEEELEGKVVEGWYTDKNFNAKSKWDLTKNIVDSSMNLYARICTATTSDGLYVQEIPNQPYTGKDIKPAVVVYSSDKILLKSGKDYTVTYADNKEANTDPWGEQLEGKSLSKVTITGKGNYSTEDPIVKEFAITQIYIGEHEDGSNSAVDVKVADQLVKKSKPQKTLSSVKVNKKALKADTDFEATLSLGGTALTDKDNKGLPLVPADGVGEYELVITGKNNYSGEIYKTIYVVDDAQKLMKNATIKLGKNLKKIDFATASALDWSSAASTDAKPADDKFSVSIKGTVIEPSKYDVWVEYANSYDGEATVGKAQLVISGNGEYSGTKAIAINIVGTAFKNASVDGLSAEKTYTGEAIYQNDVTVTADGKTLNYLEDYKISYKNNVKKGKATMTFTALPSSGYTGSVKKTFKINPATLSYDMITEGLADTTAHKMASMPYSKVAPKPSNKLALYMVDQNVEGNTLADGVALKEGTDYTVKYKDNNKVGTATMTLKGKGNLSGELAIGFDIVTASLSELYDDGVVTVVVTPVQAKAGATKDYAVKLKVLDTGKALKVNKDYSLSLAKVPAAAVNDYVYPAEGAARGAQPEVVVTGTGTYGGEITVPLSFFDKANKFKKGNPNVVVAPAVYNNGKQLTPGVTVTFNNEELDECDETGAGDFTVTYGKNNVAGKNKGSVTVTGQGVYGGKVTVKFDILPKPLNGEKPDDPADDPFNTAFYYGYIDDQITKYIDKAQGKVDGIGTVTYDKKTHTFTVPVTNRAVNIDGTFSKLVDKYRNDVRIDAGMKQVKDVFMADIQKASEIAVTASYANKAYTEKRDPAKYIEKYKDADKSIIIDDILVQYEKQINNYNKLHGTDVKTYTLDKVVGKSGSVTVRITYKNGKPPVELTYNVQFTDATK